MPNVLKRVRDSRRDVALHAPASDNAVIYSLTSIQLTKAHEEVACDYADNFVAESVNMVSADRALSALYDVNVLDLASRKRVIRYRLDKSPPFVDKC
jgi:hypothetical protein